MAWFGMDGGRVAGRPGVWVDGAKVAAVGVRVQGGVSSHGLALNVSTDLSWFDAIIPCGLSDAGVTSLERLLCAAPHHSDVEREFAAAFARVFDVELIDESFAPLSSGTGGRGWSLNPQSRRAVPASRSG